MFPRLFPIWLSILPLFSPLYLLRFEVFGVPTNVLELVVGATAVWGIGQLFVARFSVQSWLQEQWQKGFWSPVWPILLFLTASTVSMLIVPETTLDIDGDVVLSQRIAQGIWKGWIVLPIVYFFMVWSFKSDLAFVRRSLFALAGSGVVLSLWAIVQMMTGKYVTLDFRASGPFESANYLALYLGPIFLFALVWMFEAIRSKDFQRLGLWVGLNLILGAALWGTESYAAFFAVAAGVVFYGVLHPGIRKDSKALFFGFVVLGMTFFLLTQSQTLKFQQFLNFSERTSSSVRIEVYRIATALIHEHPFLGIGLGQFEVQYQINAPEILGHVPYEWVMLHPHNLLLALWLNTGLLGLLAMGWLIGLVFLKFYRERGGFWNWLLQKIPWIRGDEILNKEILNKRGEIWNKNFCSLLLISMLVVILVHGLFDTPFFKNDLAFLWWLVVFFLI